MNTKRLLTTCQCNYDSMPFQPGNKLSPGRPPKRKLEAERATALIQEKLQREFEPIVDKAIEDAKVGDKGARDWLTDRAYGKPAQAVNLSGEITTRKIILADE